MNILREIRKVKKRSIWVRILILIFFATFLIMNTFAWYSITRKIPISNMAGVVTPWDVEFYVADSDVPIEKTVTFTVDEMYPGMPEFEDYIFIRNVADGKTLITYELKTITLFGELIYSRDEIENFENELEPVITTNIIDAEKEVREGEIVLMNGDNNYPFKISYSYDKDKIFGAYVTDSDTPDSFATFTLNIDWDYELLASGIVSASRDNLDTDFGKRAYEFYDSEDEENAMVIEIMLKAERIDE